MKDVVTFDTAEATLEKVPKVYDEFKYDNESNEGALNKLNDINEKVNTISSQIDSLADKYIQLQGMYEEFTGFNETMNINIMSFKSATNGVKVLHNKLVTELQNQISAAAKADDELLEDVDLATETMAQTDGEELKSKEDIAAEVIAGKWGSGDDRKAALEAAGYNPAEIQGIVNNMVNGGGTGGTTTAPVTEAGTVTTPDPAAYQGGDVGTSPTVTPVTTGGSVVGNAAVDTARTWLNTPYVYGGNGSGGIDCSGLTQKVAAQYGVSLPRTTGEQVKCGVGVSLNDVQPGDLLFTTGGKHVVICSGRNEAGQITVISASSVAGKVTEGVLSGTPVAIRRVF